MLTRGVTEIGLKNPGERFMRHNALNTSSYEVRRRGSVRELGSPGMRAARTTAIHLAGRSTDGRLRNHRGMVQPPSTSPEPGLAVAYQLRKITSTWACGPKPVTVHQGGTTPSLLCDLRMVRPQGLEPRTR